MEALSDWMNQNWSLVQSQNVSAFLLTLATINFVPSNWETLWNEKISPFLKQTTSEPKWNSSTTLLDVAWSLAVLDQLDANLAQSVLNDTYLLKITSKQLQNLLFFFHFMINVLLLQNQTVPVASEI